MKKVIFTLIFSIMFIVAGLSQNTYIEVQGHLTMGTTGQPLNGVPVYINISDSVAGYYYYDTTYTWYQGLYWDTIIPPSNITQGVVYISVFDSCLNSMVYHHESFNSGVNYLISDFIICDGSTYINNYNTLQEVGEVYPNPFSDKTNINISSTYTQNIILIIYNQLGQQMSNFKRVITKGENKISIDVSNVPSGLYNLQISNENGEIINKRILKK